MKGRVSGLTGFLTAGFPPNTDGLFPAAELGAPESSELNFFFLNRKNAAKLGPPRGHFSCMTHGGVQRLFRDPAPFKGDLFTSMCRFLDFYSGSWGGWSIYSECMGFSGL